jgi:hypothetical protein
VGTVRIIEPSDVIKIVGDGRIFSATFVKKDGTIRVMNCRRGVSKGVTGVGLAFNPSEKQLLGVFDMHKDQHRFINLQTLQRIQAGGQVYEVRQ